jgi:hypothetical protein
LRSILKPRTQRSGAHPAHAQRPTPPAIARQTGPCPSGLA